MGPTDIVLYVLTTYLAATLLASSLAKLVEPSQFARVLKQQGLAPPILVPGLTWSIPIAEFIVASGLAFGLATPLLAGLALGLFLVFFTATAALALQGKDAECGCFGVVFKERIDGATLLRDIGFIAAAAACLYIAIATSADAGRMFDLLTGMAMVALTFWIVVVPTFHISRAVGREGTETTGSVRGNT